MAGFLYQMGQRVKEKDSGKIGRVERRDADPTLPDVRFYQVKFEDGKSARILEKDLWPADPD
jgi:hypothetical protein